MPRIFPSITPSWYDKEDEEEASSSEENDDNDGSDE